MSGSAERHCCHGLLVPALLVGSLLYHLDTERTHAKAAAHSGMVTIEEVIDCGTWLRALDRCLTPPAEERTVSLQGLAASYRPDRPDYAGIKRDTYYFLGLQLSVVSTLYFMPESVSGWSEEQKNQHHAQKWWRNVSQPAWDEDKFYLNYVLHPYWGAAYYVRARERGYDERAAFWYSALLSTLYEAGLEALFEPVSIQDFFVTPIAGAWLGRYFMDWRDATRERILDTGEVRLRDRALLMTTDPLGSASNFLDRHLGDDSAFQAAPFVATVRVSHWEESEGPVQEGGDLVYGISLNLRW